MDSTDNVVSQLFMDLNTAAFKQGLTNNIETAERDIMGDIPRVNEKERETDDRW